MTRLKLAIGKKIGKLRLGSNSFWRWRLGEEHAENLAVHSEMMCHLLDHGRFALESDVHINPRAVLLVGDAAECALVHFLNGFDFAACRGDLGGELVDAVLNRFFFSCRVQYEQAFVSFHSIILHSLSRPLRLRYTDSLLSECRRPASTAPGLRPPSKFYPLTLLRSN